MKPASCLALLLLAGACLGALAAPAAAAPPKEDECLAKVLDGLNQATAAVKTRGDSMPDAQLRYWMDAWENCGGINPYHLTVAAAGQGVGGRKLLGRSNCSKLSCYRNSITNGNVLCNAWCGLFAYCDAAQGSWGHCRYAG